MTLLSLSTEGINVSQEGTGWLTALRSQSIQTISTALLRTCPQNKKLIIREILRLSHKREPAEFHWNLGIEPIHLKATNVPFAQRNKQKKIKKFNHFIKQEVPEIHIHMGIISNKA